MCVGGGQSNMVLSDPVSNSSFLLFMTDGVHLVSSVDQTVSLLSLCWVRPPEKINKAPKHS